MFVSSGQIFVFISCFAIGVILGVIFSALNPFIKKIKISLLRNIIYALYFLVGFVFYFFIGYLWNFPSIRLYMPIGVIVGIVVSAKSFDLILAKIGGVSYNIRRKITGRKKRCRKGNSKE